MNWERRTQEIIEAAEKAIAELAAEAAAARDYSRATALLATAQRISDAAKLTGRVPAAKQVDRNSADEVSTNSDDASSLSPETSSVTRSGKRSKRYPRFKRDDSTLVKIGWSKSDKSTYEHRSPRDVLDRLVARIADVGAQHERFTTEQLMPLHDAGGSELPSYQVYLCLAWLVSQGLIERHGRQGYTVADAPALSHVVDQAWTSLQRR